MTLFLICGYCSSRRLYPLPLQIVSSGTLAKISCIVSILASILSAKLSASASASACFFGEPYSSSPCVPKCSVSTHWWFLRESGIVDPLSDHLGADQICPKAVPHPCNRSPGTSRVPPAFRYHGKLPQTRSDRGLRSDKFPQNNHSSLSQRAYAPAVRPQIRDARSLLRNGT